jgi:uncharacterized Ntn-hydrolase superfamily protein
MAIDLLQFIEQQKDLLTPENYQSIKENYDAMPEELKEAIFTQLQNAAYLKKMVDEYEDQRIQALDEASKKLKEIKNGYLQTYKEAFRQMESEDKNEDGKNADDELNNL